MQPIEIFIAYSHKDLAFKDELRTHLRPLVRANRARVWDDYDIEAGREWDAVIKERLYGAQIILLLVSPDSLDSDYFYGKEVTASLERHARGEAVVVPVIVRSCLWQQTPLGALEALPTKGRPVASWPVRDDAWHAAAQEVSALVDARRAELEQLSALDSQRRAFAAAFAAADQLFQNQNWPEARKAFADALGLHQPGFAPDADGLRARITDCERYLAAAAEADRRALDEQKRQADENRRRLAALAAQQEAERQAAEAAERRRQKDEQRQAAEAEKQRRREAAAGAPNRLPLFGGLAVVTILLVGFLAWRSCKAPRNGGSPANPPTEQPAPQDAETKDFAAAKAAGTLPALRRFLNQYPEGRQKAAAQTLLNQLQTRFDNALNDARTLSNDQNKKPACTQLQTAFTLDPANDEVLRLRRKLNCQ